ncbi:DNL zinc finger [Diaporthe helianthi]|uniref:DNL zinc finger n=1 Tax=Diaporthe helianthi TaxID=158607 RepID=A0A2P5IF20_DIAHE|nr:DNL zinc finger [Diaporthe helianthi]
MHDTGPRGVLEDGGLQLESLQEQLHSVGFSMDFACYNTGNVIGQTLELVVQLCPGTDNMASRSTSSGLRALARSANRPSSSFTRPALQRFILPVAHQTPQRAALLPPKTPSSIRLAHSVPRPRAPTSTNSTTNTPQQPTYELTFTCIPCGTRSAHNVSKQGYHHGSVLITCPSCRNRHVISDHLNIFGNKSLTVEDLMREKGRLVKRGTLGEDGDVEFWEDGSTTTRAERQADGADPKPMPRKSRGDAGLGDAPGSTFGKA